MEDNIYNIKDQYFKRVEEAQELSELDSLFLELFGKNGLITQLPKSFVKLSSEEKKTIGPLFNQTKQELEQAITERRNQVREESYQRLSGEALSLSKPEMIKSRVGQMHPVTIFENETIDLFKKLGFHLFESPHIDTDYYNFEVLNIPQNHPARDLWDTLYVARPGEKVDQIQQGNLLLRTHTSNAQVRMMRQIKPPFRMMIIDRCFRYENLDARHEHTLDQFEIVLIDKGLNMANLQYLAEYFLKNIFGPEIKVQLRPKYYPFVEPGAGFYGQCIFCKGKGCHICGTGWLELGGAGMIHPTVLKNGGIDPEVYSGIAWGMGPERMAMLKYGITDIRTFKSGDLRMLGDSNKYSKGQQ